MKNILFVFLIFILVTSCNKDKDDSNKSKYGSVKQQIRVATEKIKALKSAQELRYNQFGDFITSLTPTNFVGEFNMVRFKSTDSSSMMTLIQVEWTAERVKADFSKGVTLSVIPVLNGDLMMNADGQGGFYKNAVTFDLLWIGMGIKQVLELPTQYNDITLNQFNGQNEYAEKIGNILTTGLLPLNQIVDDLSTLGNEINFYFGRTDSTYLNYGSIIGNAPVYHIRSSKFNNWTMNPPLADETKTITSTIVLNNDNIIQLYAGADNIPYTSDDIIVLEPRFWERINVYVEEKID